MVSDNHNYMKIGQFIVDCRVKLWRTKQIHGALTIFFHDKAMWQTEDTIIHSQEKYSTRWLLVGHNVSNTNVSYIFAKSSEIVVDIDVVEISYSYNYISRNVNETALQGR